MENLNIDKRQPQKRIAILVWISIIITLFMIAYQQICIGRTTLSAYNISTQNALETAGTNIPTSVVDTVELPEQPLVLCYHQIRDWVAGDSRSAKAYIVPIRQFSIQMQTLHDSGYHAILPDQWLDHLKYGTRLPEKPVLLTFDDGTESQFVNALPLLNHYGFNAVFFVMTVTLDKSRYMTREQVRYLSDHGHQIGCHTWDHHDVTTYNDTDWQLQLERPTRLLEQLTGRPVRYFAYPFGSWNMNAVNHLKTYSYLAAFQLGGPADRVAPRFTIRRILVDGHWNKSQFINTILSFHHRKT